MRQREVLPVKNVWRGCLTEFSETVGLPPPRVNLAVPSPKYRLEKCINAHGDVGPLGGCALHWSFRGLVVD